jgi:hypothetical protein
VSEFRFHGNAREFEKKLREALERARRSKEMHRHFVPMPKRMPERLDQGHRFLKADIPENFN